MYLIKMVLGKLKTWRHEHGLSSFADYDGNCLGEENHKSLVK